MKTKQIPNCNRYNKFDRYEKEVMRVKWFLGGDRDGKEHFVVFVEYNPNEAEFSKGDMKLLDQFYADEAAKNEAYERLFAQEKANIEKNNPGGKLSHAKMSWQFFETEKEALDFFDEEMGRRENAKHMMGSVEHWKKGTVTASMC